APTPSGSERIRPRQRWSKCARSSRPTCCSRSRSMPSCDALFEWLLDGAPGATNAPAIAQRIGDELHAAGVPLDRFGVFVTTLHPNVLGRAFIWEPKKEMRVLSLTKEVRAAGTYDNSPIGWVNRNAKEWRWQKGDPDPGYGIIPDLIAMGCVDYVCEPMIFTSGEVHV